MPFLMQSVYMKVVHEALLWMHILTGAIGLVTGTVSLLRRKGDTAHRSTGNVFYISMLLAGGSAFALALIKPNHILLITAVFTIYLVVSGRRYLGFRPGTNLRRPGRLDWSLTAGMLLTAGVFIVYGLRLLLRDDGFGWVMFVFALIGLLMVRNDYKNYSGKRSRPNFWITSHLQRMTAAYIAALTAFIVVNGDSFAPGVPGVLLWLLPTALLTPLIFLWSRRFGSPGKL